MTQVTAGFETGVNGNNILTTDAGDATAWDVRSLGTGGSAVYDNSVVHLGTLSALLTRGTAGAVVLAWSTALGTVTDHYGRAYVYIPANPGTAFSLIQFTSGGANACNFRLNADGTITIRNSAGAVVVTSTTALTLSAWNRLGWHITHDTVNGFAELKIFAGADADKGAPTETISGSSLNLLANADRVNFQSDQNASYVVRLDNLVGGAAAYPGATPPANTVAPAVTGTPTVGQTLTCSNGTWQANPSFARQWQRDNHGGGSYSNIGGATATTYVPTDTDDGCQVRCVVTGTNGGGSTAANSNAVSVVEPAPANTVAPAIVGTLTIPSTLSCTPGAWTNMTGFNPTYSYQWQRSADGISGWANIGGATSSTYTLTSSDLANYLRCRVTATNTGSAVTASSNVLGPAFYMPVVTIEAAFGYTPTDLAPVWTDITAYARSCNWQRGRQNELNQTQAGTGSLILRDTDSTFDSRNAASPFYPNVKPGVPVRAYISLGASVYPLWKMFTERKPRTVRVTDEYTEWQFDLIDGFALLAAAGISGDKYNQKTTNARIDDVLDNIAWPADARNLGVGASTVVAVTFPDRDGTKAQSHLLQVVDSENGLLFCDGSGDLTFIGRHELITDAAYTVSTATFRDDAGSSGYPYVGLVPSHDLDTVFNKATGTREGGVPQVFKDVVSRDDYLLRQKDFTSLVTSDNEVLNQIQWKIGQFAQPLNRVDSITIMPLSNPADTGQVAAGLARELAHRITVLETPPGFAAEQSDDYVIQHISGSIEIGPVVTMKLSFGLWPASTTAFWIAGDAVQSLAGVSTRAGY